MGGLAGFGYQGGWVDGRLGGVCATGVLRSVQQGISHCVHSMLQMPERPLYCLYRMYRLQAKLYPRILAAMKPGATLGLSHGFLLGVMQVGGWNGWVGAWVGWWVLPGLSLLAPGPCMQPCAAQALLVAQHC